jgi:hypothetical protein
MGQFFLMNYILQIDYWSYGFQVMRGLLRGSDWLENKVFFPRIVFCDFTIRYLGDNNPKFTVSVLARARDRRTPVDSRFNARYR